MLLSEKKGAMWSLVVEALKFKVILVGDSGVGKTALFLRYTSDNFDVNTTTSIGGAFMEKSVTLSDAVVVLKIWDTAGHERFRAITRGYYRDAAAAIVVYDVTNKTSFDTVKRWTEELRETAGPDVLVTLVGNKADLTKERVITLEDGQLFAEMNGLRFAETSAKTAMNVDDVFCDIGTGHSSQNTTCGFGESKELLKSAKYRCDYEFVDRDEVLDLQQAQPASTGCSC